MSKSRAPLVALEVLLNRRGLVPDPSAFIEGRVLVDGQPARSGRSRVRRNASLRVVPKLALRGSAKLSEALEVFGVVVADRVALDLGASSGGFTSELLARGCRRVYAVDAGVGQLLGSLRQQPRVVNLEGVNLASLDPAVVPDAVEVLTVDLSYISLARALRQLGKLTIHRGAELIALVKPMFELSRGSLPRAHEDLAAAVEAASAAAAVAGWHVDGVARSSVGGRHGAVEFFLHGSYQVLR